MSHIHRAGVVCECGVDIDEELARLKSRLAQARELLERVVDAEAPEEYLTDVFNFLRALEGSK